MPLLTLRARACVLSLTSLVLVLALACGARAASDEVLILGSSVSGGTSSTEALEVTARGFTPVVVDDSTWQAMSTSDFESYKAIVIGDPTCSETPPSVAVGTAATWGPAISGNTLVIGTDPVYHGKTQFIDQGIDFTLASATGKTGAYLDLSCNYDSQATSTTATMLEGLRGAGAFTVHTAQCYNDAHIVATHPAFAGLTDSYMSGWSCSVHEVFDSWPGDFQVLAIARDYNSTYTASDGTVGAPYVLASGSGLHSFPLSLDPLGQTADVGSSATVTAQLLDDATAAPVSGQVLSFRVAGGPNAGRTGTCSPSTCATDANGQVRFFYTGGSTGTDTLQVWLDRDGNGSPSLGEPQTTASVTWTTPATACRGILAIGARGSGETDHDFSGYGHTVWNAIQAFEKSYTRGPVTTKYVRYQSNGIQVLFKPIVGVNQYVDGMYDGISKLDDMLYAAYSRCPHRGIVLFGYSQGAAVVDRELVNLDHSGSPVLGDVKGVGLVADPQRLGTARYTTGTAHHNLNGISRTFAIFPADDLPAPIYGRIISHCDDGDMVCAWDTGLLAMPFGLARAIANTKYVHTQYWKYASSMVGGWVAVRASS